MPLIPAFRKQKKADLRKFEASLVYKVSSRTARAVTQRNPVLKREKYMVYTEPGRAHASGPGFHCERRKHLGEFEFIKDRLTA